MPVVRRFSTVTLTYDDRYAPILISIWSGLADVEAARWHFERQRKDHEALIAKGQKLISISDATESQRPSPAVRKFWADEMANTPPEIDANTLGTYVVITSPMMRGVMTAIGWLNERARAIKSVPTLRDAIRQALDDLDAAGIPRPEGLDPETYEPPVNSEVA